MQIAAIYLNRTLFSRSLARLVLPLGKQCSKLSFLVVKCSNNKHTNTRHKDFTKSYPLIRKHTIPIFWLGKLKDYCSTQGKSRSYSLTDKTFSEALRRNSLLNSTKANCACRKFFRKTLDKKVKKVL